MFHRVQSHKLTRLSLSFGGSWGSVAERLGGGGEASTFGFGFSTLVSAGDSTLAFGGSAFFSPAGGSAFSEGFSDGATWEAPSDFEMIAILVPGSTVSPSLATN